jgi:urease accessory protein
MQCRRGEIAEALELGNPTGILRVRAERIGERTVLTDVYRTAPFHLGQFGKRDDAEGSEIVIQGVGPGYLPGDRVEIGISTGENAILMVRDQAALKLFPSTTGQSAVSTISLRADAGSELIYLPGELIPYRQSNFEQRADIEADPSAHVAYAEIVTPGRTAMGEQYAFERLDLRLEVRVGGAPLLRDRSLVEPGKRSMTSLGRSGLFNVTGALYLIGSRWRSIGFGTTKSGARWASDGDGRYVLIRYAAQTAQEIHSLIRQHLIAANLVIA